MKNTTFLYLTKSLNIFMLILMVFNFFVLTALPAIAKWYMALDLNTNYISNHTLYYYILIILYLSGICALIILNHLRKIFKTCSLENPFIVNNVRSLKVIAVMSLIITIIFTTKLFVFNSFFTMVVVFVFLIATLFAYVLSVLFERAIAYKEENDFTI